MSFKNKKDTILDHKINNSIQFEEDILIINKKT